MSAVAPLNVPHRPVSTAPQGPQYSLVPDGPMWRPRRPSLIESAAGIWASAWGTLASPVLAQPLAGALTRALGADAPSSLPLVEVTGDIGWFGPDSVSWRVHSDYSMFVSGFAAFAIQLLHPRALAGVIEHSSFEDDFMARTRRTGEYIMNVTFGSTEDAERATAILPRIHDRVNGITPDGRPYSANEPELLDFVHVTQFVATAGAYQLFGGGTLSDEELDQYIYENARVGAAIGVENPPESWDQAMESLYAHLPNLSIGEQGSLALQYLSAMPDLPAPALPLWRTLYNGAMASLPPFANEMIRGPQANVAELAACRSLIRGLNAVLPESIVVPRARARIGQG